MTICRKCSASGVSYPVILLHGKWLKETGFKIGHVIDVQYKKTKLIITIAENQRFKLDD
ncbi:type I addiction module toxin, SymE family [Elizabethkingia anophelis]|nr:type I addiction module toxin, SymE family [Elizabethkingia anophelis]